MSEFEKLNRLVSAPAAAVPGTMRFFVNADGEARLEDENAVVQSIRPAFPKELAVVKLPTFAGALASGATHTYTIPLGATYSEILLGNFQWITSGSTDSSEKGSSLGHGVFSQETTGPMIVANTIPGKWHRVYKILGDEFANNVGTDLAAQIFDGIAETPVPLGYGSNLKDVAIDHIDAFGKKVQIDDIYLSGTDLIVKLKNVEPVDSINFDTYTGVVKVFGYRDQTYFSTVAAGGFMAISGDRVSGSLWISEDYGITWADYTDGAQTNILAGSSAYEDGGDYFMAFLDYNFDVWSGNSAMGYAWTQANAYSIPWGGNDFQDNGGADPDHQSYGGNLIDWNENIGAFLAFNGYIMDACLFFTADNFVNVGQNSPLYDDVLPVFRASAQIPDMNPYNPGGPIGQAQNQNPYVKVVGTDDLFLAFCYLAGGTTQVVEITCTADTVGSLQSTYFFIGAEQNAGARYQPWFNVSGGGTDPLSGGISLEVDITLNDSDAAAAAALDAALTGTGDFTCSTVGGVVTVTTVLPGFASGPQDLSTGFGFAMISEGVSFRKQALWHSADKGTTWAEIMAAAAEWKDASNRFVNVSDDGLSIYVAVMGETGHASYPYDSGEIRFNYSTDGGATFAYPDGGGWPLISNAAALTYSSQNHDSPYVSEGLIAKVAGGDLIAIFRGGANYTPQICRSSDNGANWSANVSLSAWSAMAPLAEETRGRQSDVIDEFFAFISYGYTNNDATSFAYKGGLVTTLTNWDAFGVV